MGRALALVVLVAAVLTSSGVSAHEETDYESFVEGSDSALAWLGDVDNHVAAGLVADRLARFLLDIEPAACYRELYLAHWALYGSLVHLSDPYLYERSRGYVVDDLGLLAETSEASTCAFERKALEPLPLPTD